MFNQRVFLAVLTGLGLLGSMAPAMAQDSESSGAVQACLKAWGKHPFGSNPPTPRWRPR